MLLLQPIQPRGLIHAQPAVFLLPALVGVLGDAELWQESSTARPLPVSSSTVRRC